MARNVTLGFMDSTYNKGRLSRPGDRWYPRPTPDPALHYDKKNLCQVQGRWRHQQDFGRDWIAKILILGSTIQIKLTNAYKCDAFEPPTLCDILCCVNEVVINWVKQAVEIPWPKDSEIMTDQNSYLFLCKIWFSKDSNPTFSFFFNKYILWWNISMNIIILVQTVQGF